MQQTVIEPRAGQWAHVYKTQLNWTNKLNDSRSLLTRKCVKRVATSYDQCTNKVRACLGWHVIYMYSTVGLEHCTRSHRAATQTSLGSADTINWTADQIADPRRTQDNVFTIHEFRHHNGAQKLLHALFFIRSSVYFEPTRLKFMLWNNPLLYMYMFYTYY